MGGAATVQGTMDTDATAIREYQQWFSDQMTQSRCPGGGLQGVVPAVRAHREGAGLTGRPAGGGLGGGVPGAPRRRCSQTWAPTVASVRPAAPWAVGAALARRGGRRGRARWRGSALPVPVGVALRGVAVTPGGGRGAGGRGAGGRQKSWHGAADASACGVGMSVWRSVGGRVGGRASRRRTVAEAGLRGAGYLSVGRTRGLGGVRARAWGNCGARAPEGGRGTCRWAPVSEGGAVLGGPVRGRRQDWTMPTEEVRDCGWVRPSAGRRLVGVGWVSVGTCSRHWLSHAPRAPAGRLPSSAPPPPPLQHRPTHIRHVARGAQRDRCVLLISDGQPPTRRAHARARLSRRGSVRGHARAVC